jgi:hypothetical protein
VLGQCFADGRVETTIENAQFLNVGWNLPLEAAGASGTNKLSYAALGLVMIG